MDFERGSESPIGLKDSVLETLDAEILEAASEVDRTLIQLAQCARSRRRARDANE